jgi:hypothetical protein
VLKLNIFFGKIFRETIKIMKISLTVAASVVSLEVSFWSFCSDSVGTFTNSLVALGKCSQESALVIRHIGCRVTGGNTDIQNSIMPYRTSFSKRTVPTGSCQAGVISNCSPWPKLGSSLSRSGRHSGDGQNHYPIIW